MTGSCRWGDYGSRRIGYKQKPSERRTAEFGLGPMLMARMPSYPMSMCSIGVCRAHSHRQRLEGRCVAQLGAG